jgi:hypothetical protein
MQRFRLMKIYVAAVLLLLMLAIAGDVWLRPTQVDGAGADADPSPHSRNAVAGLDHNGLPSPDAINRSAAAKIRNSME